MSEHTPGPWDFWSGYNAVDQMEAEITADEGDIVIARYNCLIGEGEANAKLMTAAPDLLEALIDIADDYSDRFDMDSPSTNPGMKIVVENARAAIARAKGETP